MLYLSQSSFWFKPEVKTRFFKPHLMPLATHEALERVLYKQVKNNVLAPVNVSQGATPIVLAPKLNGSVRVCGDFSVTGKPYLGIFQHPLPHPKELFAKLNGGNMFKKLNLSEAYVKLELDGDLRQRYSQRPIPIQQDAFWDPLRLSRFLSTNKPGNCCTEGWRLVHR